MRIYICLSVLSLALAAPENANRILGGEETSIDKHPFVANLQHALNGHLWTQMCGGSILTRTAILTAAHCVEGGPAFLWRAALGSSYATTPMGGTIHLVLRFSIHPQFNSPLMDNNVAIVHLLMPAVYSATVQPARIAGSRYFIPDGTKLTAIGWGAFSHDTWYPETLRNVELELLHQGICWTRYLWLPGAPRISDGMLCAGIENQGGKGTCKGDCGGPLVHEGDIVVGITSWNHECGADLMYPSIFTRVSHYAEWIVNAVDNA